MAWTIEDYDVAGEKATSIAQWNLDEEGNTDGVLYGCQCATSSHMSWYDNPQCEGNPLIEGEFSISYDEVMNLHWLTEAAVIDGEIMYEKLGHGRLYVNYPSLCTQCGGGAGDITKRVPYHTTGWDGFIHHEGTCSNCKKQH